MPIQTLPDARPLGHLIMTSHDIVLGSQASIAAYFTLFLYLERVNNIEQKIRLRIENLCFGCKNDLTVVEHKPVIPFARVTDVMTRVNFTLVDHYTVKVVYDRVGWIVDIVAGVWC